MEYLPIVLIVIVFFLSFFLKKIRLLNHYLTKFILSAISLAFLFYYLLIEMERDFYTLALWSFLFLVFLIQGIKKKSKENQSQVSNS